jgi:hypothetical protein
MKFILLAYFLGMSPQTVTITADNEAHAVILVCKQLPRKPTAVAFATDGLPTKTVFSPCYEPPARPI